MAKTNGEMKWPTATDLLAKAELPKPTTKIEMKWSEAMPGWDGFDVLMTGADATNEANYLAALRAKQVKPEPKPAPEPSDKMLVVNLSNVTPVSQKARSVNRIRSQYGGRYYYVVPPGRKAPMSDPDYAPADYKVQPKYPLFARPCPVRPRHGFVDSRLVMNAAELAEVVAETLAADPEGEVILMPMIDADYSAITTPNSLAIGPGHDGATAGKGAVEFPCNVHTPSWIGYLDSIGIDEYKEAPFIEWVHNIVLGRWEPVQVRAGPKVTPGGDWAPTAGVVSAVLAVPDFGENLLAWETATKAAAPGTVAWIPNATRTSHWAVHCWSLNMPTFFGSTPPKVGDKYEATEGTAKVPPFSALEFWRGVESANTRVVEDPRRTVDVILYAVHNAQALAYFPGRDFILGWASQAMLRLGAVAAWGEARHANKNKRSREERYSAAHKAKWPALRNRLTRAKKLFLTAHWNSGYGGKAWAMCSQAALDLDTAMYTGDINPAEVLRRLNVALNTAHNNGWWLNKFADQYRLNMGAKGDPNVWLEAALMLYRVRNDAPAPKIPRRRKPKVVADGDVKVITIKTKLKPPHVQVHIRHGDSGAPVLHVQTWRTVHAYRKYDIKLTDTDVKVISKTLDTWAQAKSRADSSTRYRVVAEDWIGAALEYTAGQQAELLQPWEYALVRIIANEGMNENQDDAEHEEDDEETTDEEG